MTKTLLLLGLATSVLLLAAVALQGAEKTDEELVAESFREQAVEELDAMIQQVQDQPVKAELAEQFAEERARVSAVPLVPSAELQASWAADLEAARSEPPPEPRRGAIDCEPFPGVVDEGGGFELCVAYEAESESWLHVAFLAVGKPPVVVIFGGGHIYRLDSEDSLVGDLQYPTREQLDSAETTQSYVLSPSAAGKYSLVTPSGVAIGFTVPTDGVPPEAFRPGD